MTIEESRLWDVRYFVTVISSIRPCLRLWPPSVADVVAEFGLDVTSATANFNET